MPNVNDGVVTPVAQTELKSTDTRTKAPEAPKPEPVKEPVKEAPKPEATNVVPPEGESDAPDADSPPAAKKERMPRWVKERLERERLTTEARTREAVLREVQATQPKQEPVVEAPKLKSLEDFDFDQAAYTDYLVDVRLKDRDEKQRRETEQKKQAEAAESFKARIDAFEERAGDGSWEDIVSSPLNTDPAYKSLTDLFMGDEHDLDIAHYLASNPKEAERIRDLPKLAQIREVAKLADKFDGSQPEAVDTPAKPAPLPKKTTSAPPPPKTVSGSGKPNVDINDPGMTTEQRIAAWRKAKRG